MTQISAIVTAHNEAVLSGPTLRSAEAAIAAAEAAGLTVERIIGLDRPTADCAAFFRAFAGDRWRVEEVDCADQGAARNAFAAASTGEWIAFLDADDLWSENWLIEAAKVLEVSKAQDERAIIHPEINWFFGEDAAIHVNVNQDHPLFDARHFLFRNFYDALSLSPRAAHLDIPFALRDLERGYAYEDMQWVIETMAAGFVHRVARDTIIFKRRRPSSQNTKARGRGVAIRDLDILKIDRMAELVAIAKGDQKAE